MAISALPSVSATTHPSFDDDDGYDANRHSARSPPLRIVSINKNGGRTQVFEFHGDAEERGDSDGVLSSTSVRKFRNPSDPTNSSGSREEPTLVRFRKQIAVALRSTFLPTGFPSRTPSGYLQFSIWSWIQDLSTQLRSVLATQRILEGVGVGREGGR